MTLAEYFDDWRDQLLAYNEKLRLTEVQFVRYFSHGMGIMQRQAELVRSSVTLAPLDASGATLQPEDCLRLTFLRGQDGMRLLTHTARQAERYKERYDSERLPDTPAEFSRWARDGSYETSDHARTAVIFGRRITVMPSAAAGEILTCFYVPMIQPYSSGSAQWAAFFPQSSFETAFANLRLAPELVPYAQGLVDFAISRVLRAQAPVNPDGRQRYEFFEANFAAEVRAARENAPHTMQEAAVDYRFSPFS